MIQPSVLYMNGSTYFSFRGLRENIFWVPFESIFGFHIEAVTYVNSANTANRFSSLYQNVVFLTNPLTISNVSSLKVEFYFVSEENSSVFVPGEQYDLYTGTIGTFNLAVTTNNNIWTHKDYISINGQEVGAVNEPPSNPVPIIGSGGGTTTIPSVPYVDDEHPHQVLQYLLSIIEEQSIYLPNAYGTNKTPVAKARIEILYAEPGTNYKVDISFDSNSVKQGKFHLHLDGNLNAYGIPYYLYFKQDLVVPGQDIRWGQILNHPEKQIRVTGVIQDDAEGAPAGTYKDTITVHITAVD